MLARKEVSVTGLSHINAAKHLANDEFDVLIVDRHTLVAVHLLHLFDEVLLRLANTLDVEKFLGVLRTFNDGVTSFNFLAVNDFQVCTKRDGLDLLGAIISDDHNHATTVFFHDAHDARVASQQRGTLGGASFEEFYDARKSVGDVRTCHTTGVEGTHRQLSARFTNGLSSDDTNGLTEFNHVAGGQANAVASSTDSLRCFTRQR